MNIIQEYIPINTLRRSGQKNLGITFIVCHDTGNDGSSAQQNVAYYIKSAKDISASAHAFVDDKGVIECMPLDEKAWHVLYNSPVDNQMFGADANDHAIGVELCFSTAKIFDTQKAYDNYVEYISFLLKKYGLNETKLVGHYTLDPTRRTDPLNAFKTIGKTWTDFIDDVKKSLNTSPTTPTNAEIVVQIKVLLDKIV